jgi:hypothetical protein
VHATVHAMNLALGKRRTTVEYLDVPWIARKKNQAFPGAGFGDMAAGAVDTVVMIGTNPVYTAPADLTSKAH